MGRDGSGVAPLELGDAPPGELGHGVRAAGLGEEPQRADREVVVGRLERVAPGVGHAVDACRPTASAGELAGGLGAVRRPLPRLDVPEGDEGVEVPADGGGGETESLGEGRSGLRAPLEEGSRDALGGAVLAGGRFHNVIVA